MENIIALCIEIDTQAARTYRLLAEASSDPEVRHLFEQMGNEEITYIGWWSDLLVAWESGLVPPVPDEDELRTHLRGLSEDVRTSLPAEYTDLTTEDMLAVAAHLEFYMLDPMYAGLLDLVRPGQQIDVREAYSNHIMRLISAIEDQRDPDRLSHFLACALSRALRDQQRLSRLATQDPLTGLYNRRGFDGYVQQWSSWAARYGHSLSLLAVDLDRFKDINDTYGHPVGDEALRTVANVLRHSVRTSDLVGRYGGDEFAILAPETDAAGLAQLMERITVAIREAKTGLPGIHAHLTVSVGGSYMSHGIPIAPEQLIVAADHALYEAKLAGGNRASEPYDALAV